MKQPRAPKGPAQPAPDPEGEISDLVDLKAIAASMRAGAAPRSTVTASELSGVVARHNSVVGARVEQRDSLANVPPWFWGAVGCLSVMALGLGAFWYLTAPTGGAAASTSHALRTPPPPPVPAGAAAPGPQIVPMAASSHPQPSERFAEPPHVDKAPARHTASASKVGRGDFVVPSVEGLEPEAILDKPASKSASESVQAKALDGEPGGGTRKAPAARAGSQPADNQADRSFKDVDAALDDLQPRVRQCFQRFQIRGVAEVNLTVTATGSVQSPALTGDFEGTPTGECVIKELASAALPPFKGGPVKISHQYVFR